MAFNFDSEETSDSFDLRLSFFLVTSSDFLETSPLKN